MPFKLPGPTERTIVFGRTGSGKSVFTVWLLSHANFDEMPWIILDYKDDKYLRSLPYIQNIKIGDIPKKPGLYRCKVEYNSTDADVAVDDYLFDILRKGRIGLFCDEGSNIPQREPKFKGLKAIFGQGRSKRVPVIFATQRPSWINKSVMSEADHYISFALATDGDKLRIREFMPDKAATPLAKYHCHWYDIKQDEFYTVRPVNEDETFNRLNERLKPKIRLI